MSHQAPMTDEEYKYHRQVAVQVPGLGWCSRMKDGRIKIEGYNPLRPEQLHHALAKALEHV